MLKIKIIELIESTMDFDDCNCDDATFTKETKKLLKYITDFDKKVSKNEHKPR